MWVNQMAVVQPRLIPSQLPCGLKYSSSNSGTPILSLWDNKSGRSSTRSVVTLTCSVMATAYRICKILSLFGRTMSKEVAATQLASGRSPLDIQRQMGHRAQFGATLLTFYWLRPLVEKLYISLIAIKFIAALICYFAYNS